ncbi:DUF2156 domain-containing protein [Paludibacter sp. 221]|uniref:DUF2156 domain-containing protein n=1 Tax=Paludibacter sp. 221 TaxID=2302939 RepID=UPI0013D13C9D|nr:phosphatidylglycerol lysyltransferase domain-containing protein [Paludibacter sp. 221]NDV45790.1 DUF2156 domain-containing protein [Paludibacter sp. 221]
MMNFKAIDLADKKAIDSCLSGNTYRACDFCFANLYSWQAKFKTTFAVDHDTLFIRYRDIGGELCYMLPIGKMPLKKAIQLIIEDARNNNTPFIMKGITVRMWDDIQKVMPDAFDYTHDRNNDEYIYLSDRLVTLKGKKLQSKRNHINRFKKDNPDWNYFTLSTNEELMECSKMLDEWENLNLTKAEKSLRYDYIATKIMLENVHTLQLCGGAVKVNGKIVAFTVGEKLTNDTFVIHVEKAYGEMNGAYTIINQQFAEHEAAEYTYINREEDMGLEYLRKAKESYYPDILLQERTLTLKKQKS